MTRNNLYLMSFNSFCVTLNLFTERKLKWQKATSYLFSFLFSLLLYINKSRPLYSDALLMRQYVFKVDSAGIRKQLKWARAHTHTSVPALLT